MHALLNVCYFLDRRDTRHLTKKKKKNEKKLNNLWKISKQKKNIAIICPLFYPSNVHPLFKFKMHETGLRAKAYSLMFQGMRGIQHTSKKKKCDVRSNITTK